MHYRLRWWYALLSVSFLLVLGYYYDIEPLLEQKTELKQSIKKHHQDLQNVKCYQRSHPPRVFSQNKKAEELATALIMLAKEENILLQSIKILKTTEDARVKKVHCSVVGKFKNLYGFFFVLSQSTSLTINDFICRVNDKNLLQCKIEILSTLTIRPLAHLTSTVMKMPNPFCSASYHQFRTKTELMKTSIKEMQMVGYSKLNNKQEALVRLPNNELITLVVGQKIGKEGWVVEQISPKYARINNYILRMRG